MTKCGKKLVRWILSNGELILTVLITLILGSIFGFCTVIAVASHNLIWEVACVIGWIIIGFGLIQLIIGLLI